MTEGAEVVIHQNQDKTSEVVRSNVEVARGKRVELSITLGDLTEADADAIVVPANPGFEFAHFAGVQAAVARKAGMETFREAERKAKAYVASGQGVKSPEGLVGVPLGFATDTTPGKLKRIKRIIHVNNMRTEEGKAPCDEEVVRTCVGSSLAVADSARLESVAFPAMGTGLWGMSMAESLRGTINGVRDYFQEINPASKVKKVSFVVYAQPSLQNAEQMRQLLANEVSGRRG